MRVELGGGVDRASNERLNGPEPGEHILARLVHEQLAVACRASELKGEEVETLRRPVQVREREEPSWRHRGTRLSAVATSAALSISSVTAVGAPSRTRMRMRIESTSRFVCTRT